MADGVRVEVDAEALLAALARLPDQTAQPLVNEAARETTEAIVREAKARLARQLGPQATHKTEQSITNRPAYNGNGWIVIVEREPMPNLPLWIEKGTKRGKPGSHRSPASRR